MRVHEVRDFSKRGDALPTPNLVEVQRESYQRFLQKDDGVGAFPFGISRRKVAADVARCDGSQQGVSDRVEKNVAVRMSGQAFRVGKLHAAYFQRDACLKLVRIPTIADPHSFLPLINADDADLKRFKKTFLGPGLADAYEHFRAPVGEPAVEGRSSG